MQAELSVWSPEALERLLPWCEARGVGFLAAMPLGNGFLTGTLTPGQGFEPDDVRAAASAVHGGDDGGEPAGGGGAAADRGAARSGATPAQVALAWVLAQGRHVVAGAGDEARGVGGGERGRGGAGLTARDLAEIAGLPPARGSWD